MINLICLAKINACSQAGVNLSKWESMEMPPQRPVLCAVEEPGPFKRESLAEVK